jgi:hypothetical protein
MSIMPNINSNNTAGEDTDFVDDLSVKKGKSPVGKKRKRQNYKRKNYPKKALTAYNIFFKETREKILTEHGKTNFQEMVRKIAALWKEITPEDKLRFDAIASRDLARYKEEVGEYEQDIVEKSRKKLIAEVENKKLITINPLMPADLTPWGINAKNYHENDDRNKRIIFPVQNVRIPNIPHDNMLAGVGQGPQENSNVVHTLSSNELQMAQHRLEEDIMSRMNTEGESRSTTTIRGNGMCGGRDHAESKWTPSEMQMYRQNLYGNEFFGGDRTVASGEVAARNNLIALGLSNFGGNYLAISDELERKKRIAQASIGDETALSNDIQLRKRWGLDRDMLATSNEIERRNRIAGLGENHAAIFSEVGLREKSRESFGLGADSMTALNQPRFENRLNNRGKDRMTSLNAEEFRNIIRQAEMIRSGASDENDIRLLLGRGRDFMPSFDKMEIQNQMVRSNEAQMRNRLLFNNMNGGLPKALSGAEMMKILAAGGDPMATSTEGEVRKGMSMAVQNQIAAPDAELRKRIAMLQNQELMAEQLGHSPRTMGLANVFDNFRLREQERIRRLECMMTQSSVGAPPSVHGGLSRELSSQAEMRLLSGLIARGSFTSESLDNDDIQLAFTQSHSRF